jgi:hypothetical protein
MKDFLELSDPYEISHLIIRYPNIEELVEYVVTDNFTTVRLPATPEITHAYASLSSADTVNAVKFIRLVKRIRGQMISMKKEKRNGGFYERPFNR